MRWEPLLVRAGVGVAGLTALLVAAPAPMLGTAYGLLGAVVLAAGPAVAPDGRWPTALVLAAVAGWLAATTWWAEPVVAWRVLALSAALYLLHTLAALAAGLPYDAVVAPDVVVGWLARALAVVVVASLLAGAVLIGLARVGAGGYPVATVAGLAVAAGLAATLSAAARRSVPTS